MLEFMQILKNKYSAKTIERLRRKAIEPVKWRLVAHLKVMGAI